MTDAIERLRRELDAERYQRVLFSPRPDDIRELLDSHERMRLALETATDWLDRLAAMYDPEDTEGGKAAIAELREALEGNNEQA